jgi:hypothetical protein
MTTGTEFPAPAPPVLGEEAQTFEKYLISKGFKGFQGKKSTRALDFRL